MDKNFLRSFSRVFCVIFAMFVCCNVDDAMASGGSFYAVQGIKVSSSSLSSSEAKKLALQDARGKAFSTVLSRILLPEDVKQVLMPDTYNLEKFVKSLRINGEKTTSTTYTADVDMVLDEKLVNAYLSNQGFDFLLEKLPMTLLVLRGVDGYDLGIAGVSEKIDNVVQYVVAYSSVFNFDVTRANVSDFRAKFPNVNNVVIVDVKDVGGKYDIHFYDKVFGIDENFTVAQVGVADTFLKKLNSAYKRAVIAGSGNGENNGGIVVVMPIYSMQDWISMQSKLSKISGVKALAVQALKYDKAQVVLNYSYDVNSLVSALRSLGFVVEQKSGYLRIAR